MKRRLLTAAALSLAASLAGTRASALTLPVTGGPGLDQGELCASGSLCPGTPSLSLVGTAPVTGSFTFNSGPSTVDFTLTLLAPANFTGALSGSLAPGSTVSAAGVPVLVSPLGGGAYLLFQSAPATGSASITDDMGLSLIASTPAVSGLTCTVGTGADQCGVSVGPGGLTFGGIPDVVPDLDAFLTYNVNVPEPGTLLLLSGGIAGLGVAARRRR